MQCPFIACSLILYVALLTPAFAIESSAQSKSDVSLPLFSDPIVARGMSRETVELMLGQPGAKLSPDVWVYWDFKAKRLPGGEAVDTLIVGFDGGRVTLLRLSRSEPVRAFIARQKARLAPLNDLAQ